MQPSVLAILRAAVAATFVAATIAAVNMAANVPQAVSSKAPSAQSPAEHHGGVNSRGDHAMGFSHETTTHHFRLYKTGGAIEVLTNNPADSATRDEIRMHLSHIIKLFSAGNFDIPMFIHDTTPPGAATMTKRREQIHYRYQETERGAKIRITTSDREALEAIHAFLRFQISDHQTGDSTEIANQ